MRDQKVKSQSQPRLGRNQPRMSRNYPRLGLVCTHLCPRGCEAACDDPLRHRVATLLRLVRN